MDAWQRQLRDDCEQLMARDDFRRVLFEFLRMSGITAFTRDEQQSLFLEGKRSLGLEIFGLFSRDAAEPFDAIRQAIEAEMNFTLKGTQDDDRDSHE